MARSVWKASYVDNNIIRRFDELLLIAVGDFATRFNIEFFLVDRKLLRQNILEISTIAKLLSEEDPIEVWSRGSVILPEFVGFFFLVYNGHVFQKFVVKQDMVGKKFGEFAATKRIGPNIHYPKKKKKKS